MPRVAGKRLVGLKRPTAGALDRWTVGNRVAEGHAKFDNVRPGRRQSREDRRRGLAVRVAGHDESQKRGAAFGGDLLKAQIEACGHRLLVTTMPISAKAKPTGCDREAASLAAPNKTGLSTGVGNFDRGPKTSCQRR